MEFFLSMMGFACNGYVFLFKDVVFSDSLGSKMELGEIWPQILPYLPPFATKFGPINVHKLPTYFLNIMLERKKPYFNILPKILPLDETLILPEPVGQIQDYRKRIDL